MISLVVSRGSCFQRSHVRERVQTQGSQAVAHQVGVNDTLISSEQRVSRIYLIIRGATTAPCSCSTGRRKTQCSTCTACRAL